MAWNQKFQHELENDTEEQREPRDAVQTPKYFTDKVAAPHHVKAGPAQKIHFETSENNPNYARSARNTSFQQPIYYSNWE